MARGLKPEDLAINLPSLSRFGLGRNGTERRTARRFDWQNIIRSKIGACAAAPFSLTQRLAYN